MTVARLRVEMDCEELVGWIAFDRYEAQRREREEHEAREQAKPKNVDSGEPDDPPSF